MLIPRFDLPGVRSSARHQYPFINSVVHTRSTISIDSPPRARYGQRRSSSHNFRHVLVEGALRNAGAGAAALLAAAMLAMCGPAAAPAMTRRGGSRFAATRRVTILSTQASAVPARPSIIPAQAGTQMTPALPMRVRRRWRAKPSTWRRAQRAAPPSSESARGLPRAASRAPRGIPWSTGPPLVPAFIRPASRIPGHPALETSLQLNSAESSIISCPGRTDPPGRGVSPFCCPPSRSMEHTRHNTRASSFSFAADFVVTQETAPINGADKP
jgi:hypothetical protein